LPGGCHQPIRHLAGEKLSGLLMPIERKNCDQMAAAIPGCHPQRFLNLLTTAVDQKLFEFYK